MKNGILLILCFCLSSGLWAQDFDGSFTQTGSEDTYTVNLQNDNGHVYTGTATDVGNGKLIVKVDDGAGEGYNGVAQDNGYGDFEILLINSKTGEAATGTVDIFHF